MRQRALGRGRQQVRQQIPARPQQLIQVANDRWQDALALLRSERFNAAVYIGGLVVECLLKAILLREGQLPLRDPLYFSHDLHALLRASVDATDTIGQNKEHTNAFERVASWGVWVRYAPKRLTSQDAHTFIKWVKEIRQCLEPLARGKRV
jgi:HEPN domain-containing protein